MTAKSDFYVRIAGRLLVAAVLLVASAIAIFTVFRLQAPHLIGQEKILTDFDVFQMAGEMARRGAATDAYFIDSMRSAQHAVHLRSDGGFMPWTYPPPYMLIVAPMGYLPIGVSYLLFIMTSFLFYLLVLRRIAGEVLPGVLFVMLPTIMILAGVGQNGFLTGGLIGAFMLAALGGRASAGLPLGLMIVKPHLAAGIALMTLLERRWRAAALAAATAAVACLATTFVFGIEIWPAFQNSVEESGALLSEGGYSLNRMTSIYAFVRSLGVAAPLAFAAHGLGALAALGATLLVWRNPDLSPQIKAAAFCVASLFVSPYNYDYDLTILGVAIAFLMRDLLKRARMLELFGLWLLSWCVLFCGVMTQLAPSGEPGSANLNTSVSWTAPLLILLIGAAYGVLRRPARDPREAKPQPTAQGLSAA